MKKLTLMIAVFVFTGLSVILAQTVVITGTVTSSVEGEGSIPGVAVTVYGTTIGTTTGADGVYTISVPETSTRLVFQFIGMKTVEVIIGGRTTIDVVMEPDLLGIDEVVVTALGITREKKTLPYASQDINAEALNITSDANIKSAIAGKVAGVQIVGQAGSKLGDAGRIRIRGAISLTSDADPLYVIDGVPTDDPNAIDMENVASVNVLKGPNATALYGQRAEYGVIMITSKKAGKTAFSVEISNNTTFEKVAYLPNYQNEYGAGYLGEAEWRVLDATNPRYLPEWSIFDGEKYIRYGFADESWGPKFDGSDYIPWYALWPDSPYYGETAKWVAQPDNIKDFYDTGVTMKNSVSVGGSGDNYSARVSFTNLDQKGIMPYSFLKKNLVSTVLEFNPTSKLTITGTLNFSNQLVSGDFDDGYSNQTTGSFNAWFNRNLETAKLRELVDLQTISGYHASWNFWGPWYYAPTSYNSEKAAFWYNPYFWLKYYKNENTERKLLGNISATYKITDELDISANVSTNVRNFSNHWELPYIIANSADPENYNVWNDGFGNTRQTQVENNYSAMMTYKKRFGDVDLDVGVGSTFRTNSFDRFRAEMPQGSKTQGLVIPDVFTYNNAKLPVTANTTFWNKNVLSMYGRFSVGYRSMIYIDGTYRKDYSSALPATKNGYGYPSIGASFIFTELLQDKTILSYGKLRAGWAQVGTDLGATLINQVYPLSAAPYMGSPQMYTNAQLIDPNIEPALNTSIEGGVDLKFLQNRVGLGVTYFNEIREKEIIPITLTTGTGYTSYLTNAGKTKRTGIEVVLEGTPVKQKDIRWDVTLNYAVSNPTIEELPEGLDAMNGPGGGDSWAFVTVTHELGGKWGQLRGTAILLDDNGNEVVNAATGMYVTNPGQYLGSILPDFTGGIINNITLFNLVNVNIGIDFQKGGKFFSLSEMWGQYSGLFEETAGVNDLGNPIRDAVADGGGVRVIAVDEAGNPFDEYIEAYDYFNQFNANVIASEFIHDASYVKLRDIAVSVNLPNSWLSQTFINTASVGFVGRNIWMIAVAKDNIHNWDPSEMSRTWGENAQLPGTRSFGFNVKLTF